MGTNFYWRQTALPLAESTVPVDRAETMGHIGKRSAAGPFCWDCEETLVVGGREQVHFSRETHNHCPKCGQEWLPIGWSAGPAAVELGFAHPRTERPTGVSGTSSFSWAQEPERVGVICEKHADEAIIEDEYGRVLTGHEFLTMLAANCGLQFTQSIGVEFD